MSTTSTGIQELQSAVSSVRNLFLLEDDSFSTKTLTALEQDGVQFNFLFLLETLQGNQVDFLTTTWQQAFNSFSTGATAEVGQCLVNPQTSFAFKRPMFRHSAFDVNALFKWLIREVLTLSLL